MSKRGKDKILLNNQQLLLMRDNYYNNNSNINMNSNVRGDIQHNTEGKIDKLYEMIRMKASERVHLEK